MLRKCTCRDKSIHFAFCFQVQRNIICCINHFYFPPILGFGFVFVFFVFTSLSLSQCTTSTCIAIIKVWGSKGRKETKGKEWGRRKGKPGCLADTLFSWLHENNWKEKHLCFLTTWKCTAWHGRDSTAAEAAQDTGSGNLRAADISRRGWVEGAWLSPQMCSSQQSAFSSCALPLKGPQSRKTSWSIWVHEPMGSSASSSHSIPHLAQDHHLMQNAFSSTCEVSVLLKFQHVPESTVSAETQSRLLAVSSCKIKNKLPARFLQWHRVNVPILQRENWGIPRQTKPAGQTPNSAAPHQTFAASDNSILTPSRLWQHALFLLRCKS